MTTPACPRLFPEAVGTAAEGPPPEELGALGGALDGGYVQVSNTGLPAGYTYFTQFVLHDLTCGEPPRLDLRPLYGGGPQHQPALYDRRLRGRLRLGRLLGSGRSRDVPRGKTGAAVLGDIRNDRTVILSQLHASWLQLHNDVFDALPCAATAERGMAARYCLTRIYHDLVREELLPRLVEPAAAARALSGRSLVYKRAARSDSVPAELLFGAGRFGHAMVRPRYRLNARIDDLPLFRSDGSAPLSDLRGQPLTGADAAINWSHYFATGDPIVVQSAAKINGHVCRPLFEFPAGPVVRSIPRETLAVAHRKGVPSGQAIAGVLGAEPVPDDYLWQAMEYKRQPAPLWYYVLKEAEYQQHGQRLGQVGGEIVAGVIAASLDRSPLACPPSLRSSAGDVRRLLQRDLGALLVAVNTSQGTPSVRRVPAQGSHPAEEGLTGL